MSGPQTGPDSEQAVNKHWWRDERVSEGFLGLKWCAQLGVWMGKAGAIKRNQVLLIE